MRTYVLHEKMQGALIGDVPEDPFTQTVNFNPGMYK